MKGRKAIVTPTAEALTKTPTSPTFLGKHGKAEWKRVASVLVDRQALTSDNLGMLEGYCTHYETVRQCSDELQGQPLWYEKEDGMLRANPLIKMRADALSQMRQYASELGLTPAKRFAGGVNEDDDFDGADIG